ncbi:Protein FAR1-RELATED SEQUENCE 5 [Ananas comosus]|uniref:Protein FAR1-RELATED SEQUENCE n=1 Tax=Ananas comosus TaxID=4615 RepID=A0A199UW93_ANACO|nr:Protein FAR1-RELATED SEQUENCE 5 [Ananas comosus]
MFVLKKGNPNQKFWIKRIKRHQTNICGCKAHLRVKRTNDGNWEVVAFVRKHNSALVASPSKAVFFGLIHQWLPTYFRDTFFAEMTTSQRSESMNALTKMFMDNHTSLCKLVIQFENVVSSRHDKEYKADFRSRDDESSLWSHNPIEIQARSNQFQCTTGYDLTKLENNCYKISTIQNSTLPPKV